MTRRKKGQKLVCIPCGREIIIDNWGASKKTLWCCGKPMGSKTKNRKAKKK